MRFIGFLLFAAILIGLLVFVARNMGVRDAIEVFISAAALTALLELAIYMMAH